MTFETIDPSLLITATGGAPQGPAQSPQGPDQDQDQSRTWGQVAGSYVNACIQGAGQSLIFGGKPRNWKEGATTAAMGCAMGVGMQAIQDVGNFVTGQR
jgi:hypothetical protein